MSGFKASSGPVDIVASGTIIAFQGNPIEVMFELLPAPLNGNLAFHESLPPLPLPCFKLIFRFIDEPAGAANPQPRSRLEAKAFGQLTLEVTLFNCTNPLGMGNDHPVLLGHADGRKLFLQWRVYTLTASDKTLYFTIYQERERDPEVLKRPTAESNKEANA
jgi:hypothetical protein